MFKNYNENQKKDERTPFDNEISDILCKKDKEKRKYYEKFKMNLADGLRLSFVLLA